MATKKRNKTFTVAARGESYGTRGLWKGSCGKKKVRALNAKQAVTKAMRGHNAKKRTVRFSNCDTVTSAWVVGPGGEKVARRSIKQSALRKDGRVRSRRTKRPRCR